MGNDAVRGGKRTGQGAVQGPGHGRRNLDQLGAEQTEPHGPIASENVGGPQQPDPRFGPVLDEVEQALGHVLAGVQAVISENYQMISVLKIGDRFQKLEII